MIVFLGPDGCGKSSVISAIEASPPGCFKCVTTYHLRPKCFSKSTDSTPVTRPHAKRSRGAFLSIIKVFYFLLDYAIGWLVCFFSARTSSTLVVFDRYYHDLLVDPLRYRYGGPMWLARWVGKLIPKPDIWILLDAPPEVLQARKQEVLFEETTRQRKEYLKLIKGLKSAFVVDAARGLDDVVADVNAIILDFMAPSGRRNAILSSVVTSVAKKVFPEGTELCLGDKTDPPGSRFWVIPGKAEEPRWILPYDSKYALPFLQQWRPYNLFSRIKWQFLMVAYRGKRLSCVPGVVALRIIVPEKSNWEHLGWPLAKPPVPVIYVGTPGPNRKAVLGLIDSQKGKVTSIGKVPLGPSAGLANNHEVDILDTLAKEKPGRAPSNLFVDRRNGIATQEFFYGSPTGRRLTERHVAFLVDLAIPGETISLREVVKDLGRQIKSLEHIDREARTVLERTLGEADDPSLLPAVWEHGDFAPWNLKSGTNGSLQAVDWEAASRQGLPLFDLVYFHSIQAFLFGEKELFPKWFRALLSQYLERLGIAPGMTRKIIRACIVRDWLRRHEEGDRARAAFLLRTLTSPLGDLV
jgi:thymidylate kinase